MPSRSQPPAIVQIDFDTRQLFFDDGSTAEIEAFVDEEGDKLDSPEDAVGVVFYHSGRCFGALLPDPAFLPTVH